MFLRFKNATTERTAGRRVAGLMAAGALAAVALALTASSATAGFPGVNGKIAFSRCEDGINCDVLKLWTMNTDGSGAGRLLTDPSHTDYDPSYSPDGRHLAFVRCHIENAGNVCGIATVDAHGNGLRQLTPGSAPAGDNYPSYSPDGSRIVFGHVTPTRGEIAVISADGSNLHSLTAGQPGSDTHPEFSPDGTKIVFQRYVSGSGYHIRLMNADGSNQHALTSDPTRRDYAPTFSPNGRQITYSSRVTGGVQTIWMIGVDGSGAHQVTSTPFQDDDPAFSPDGKRILFSRGPADGPWHVYTQAVTGGSPTQITTGLDFGAGWGRVPTPSIDSPPKVAGVAQVGHALTATAGPSSWGGSASFKWLRCTTSCAPIAGATATTYKPTNADIGKKLQVRQTQTSAGGSVSALSTATAPVTGEPGAGLVKLVRKGKARLQARLRCPATQSVACNGRLTVTARVHGHTVRIAAGNYKPAAGTSGKLTLRTTKALAKAHKLTARLVTRDDAGNITTSRRTVKLR